MTPASAETELLTVREVAMLLGVHPETIRRSIHRGGVEGVRVGRRLHVARDELARFLEQQRVRPGRAPQ